MMTSVEKIILNYIKNTNENGYGFTHLKIPNFSPKNTLKILDNLLKQGEVLYIRRGSKFIGYWATSIIKDALLKRRMNEK